MTGTISGVLIAGIFATVFGKITRITGYNIEDIETMVYVSQNSKLQIGGVIVFRYPDCISWSSHGCCSFYFLDNRRNP